MFLVMVSGITCLQRFRFYFLSVLGIPPSAKPFLLISNFLVDSGIILYYVMHEGYLY